LIAFAAKAGSIAADGDGMHSPFTAALLKHITTPATRSAAGVRRVRDEVIKTTGNRRSRSSMARSAAPYRARARHGTGRSRIRAGSAAVRGPDRSRSRPPTDSAWRDYELAGQINSKEVWDAYLETHPTGFYANLARAQRAKLLRWRRQDLPCSPRRRRANARVRDARRHPSGRRGNDPAVKPKQARKKKGKAARRALRARE